MDQRPNPYKIPPRTIVIEADQEIPVNYRENLLFCFMGMVCALVVSLSLYETELVVRWRLQRGPASIAPASSPNPDLPENFNPYENLPSLY